MIITDSKPEVKTIQLFWCQLHAVSQLFLPVGFPAGALSSGACQAAHVVLLCSGITALDSMVCTNISDSSLPRLCLDLDRSKHQECDCLFSRLAFAKRCSQLGLPKTFLLNIKPGTSKLLVLYNWRIRSNQRYLHTESQIHKNFAKDL